VVKFLKFGSFSKIESKRLCPDYFVKLLNKIAAPEYHAPGGGIMNIGVFLILNRQGSLEENLKLAKEAGFSCADIT
jgi:hypothetical protein